MLQLSDRDWAEFRVGDLFNVFCGKITTVDKSGSKFPIVSACTTNNAIIGYTDDESKLLNGNCLTIGQQTAFCTYQGNKFVATNNVDVLVPINIILNKNTGLFLCTVINNEINGKFNYGRKLSASRAVEVKINLPITSDGTPDYQFMHDYIAEREPDYSWATQCIEPNAELSLTDREWAEFRVGELFTVTGSKTTSKIELEASGIGKHPYVTTKATNNAVDGLYSIATEKGNVIVIESAVNGYVTYQGMDFSASAHVEKLIPKFEMNKYSGLFIVNMIRVLTNGMYNYGHKFNQKRIKDTIINLPITPDGTPDYDFMERYIKSLPFSKVLEAQ